MASRQPDAVTCHSLDRRVVIVRDRLDTDMAGDVESAGEDRPQSPQLNKILGISSGIILVREFWRRR